MSHVVFDYRWSYFWYAGYNTAQNVLKYYITPIPRSNHWNAVPTLIVTNHKDGKSKPEAFLISLAILFQMDMQEVTNARMHLNFFYQELYVVHIPPYHAPVEAILSRENGGKKVLVVTRARQYNGFCTKYFLSMSSLLV